MSAARRSLAQADISPSDVSHIIVVSCTGFFAPGLDVLLIDQLGLPSTTRRTMIGFMGCSAAFNGLKSASDICRSEPGAKVLVVCVELCSLHVQIENTLESIVVNSLFADGAAACLISQVTRAEADGKMIYRGSATALDSSSFSAMSWELGDTGFIMGLSPKVPELIAATLPAFVEELCLSNDVRVDDIGFWAVHPGGRQILDKTAESLQLPAGSLADSYAVLRDYGNMSSPTILFILRRIIERRESLSGQQGVALAFGPGLTTEGCLLEFG
jgi:predicted naringenin-chalcone synthase